MNLTPTAQAIDPPSLDRHFGGGDGLLSMWIAEPYVELAPALTPALSARATTSWYGYETRPESITTSFWSWMQTRHRWDGAGLSTLVSPSVGTSIGVLIDQLTKPGDGVIIQPPVFTDFKPLVAASQRQVVRNPLLYDDDHYRFDLDDFERKAAQDNTTAMILCNPHNPVGRVWSSDELTALAAICEQHGVFVIADEIHADVVLKPNRFTPFATVADGARWAALHGPIKTFGTAGICDTFVITQDEQAAERFQAESSRVHLTRNNVFGIAATAACYADGADWLDGLLDLVSANAQLLDAQLPDPIRLSELQGTYLGWLDLRGLGLDVPELASWLAESARLALSPGHWFGRQGAGFARMSIAAPTQVVEDAIGRLTNAINS